MINNRLEKHKNIYAYVDGASSGNPGYAGIGIVIFFAEKPVRKISKCIGMATNNEAEYKALLTCIRELISLGVKEAKIFSDSRLVVNQLNGYYKIKSKRLKNYVEEINRLKKIIHFDLIWVGREENRIADRLAKNAILRCKDVNP